MTAIERMREVVTAYHTPCSDREFADRTAAMTAWAQVAIAEALTRLVETTCPVDAVHPE